MKARLVFLIVCVLAAAQAQPPNASASTEVATSYIASDVRKAAKGMAFAWVDCAKPSAIDELANRSIAIAGMVPGHYVQVDGEWIDASKALVENGLVLLKNSTLDQDAAAMRITVNCLMEIGNGRVSTSLQPKVN